MEMTEFFSKYFLILLKLASKLFLQNLETDHLFLLCPLEYLAD